MRTGLAATTAPSRLSTVCIRRAASTAPNDAGYGNSDPELTALVQKLLPHAYVQTNDQLLSLTDQLRLGVRFIELDTHFFLVCTPARPHHLNLRRASCTLPTAAASTCPPSTTCSTGSTRCGAWIACP